MCPEIAGGGGGEGSFGIHSHAIPIGASSADVRTTSAKVSVFLKCPR